MEEKKRKKRKKRKRYLLNELKDFEGVLVRAPLPIGVDRKHTPHIHWTRHHLLLFRYNEETSIKITRRRRRRRRERRRGTRLLDSAAA